MGGGYHQPQQDERQDSPQHQRAVRPNRQPATATATAAKPGAAAAQQIFDGGHVARAKARPAAAARRFAPRSALAVVRRRIAAVTAAVAPRTFGVGKPAADT